MHIQYSEAAVHEIDKLWNDGTGRLKLVYDSEGCGCAVSGVPTLWIVNETKTDDMKAEGEPFATWYEPRHEVFFEDRMKIDFQPRSRAFTLSSSGQIYNAMMSIVDKR